ncbi:MAG TPA: adenosine-specific kinase [Methanomassiliicoccales archaeon]|nr:adenosine-specific kinase [Methanomassiliicoccales archaeon]
MKLDFHVVRIERPVDSNVIIGQTHFIKSAEDLYEAMVNSVPGIKFGLAFNEASGDRLIRTEGNDPELTKAAVKAAKDIGAGHVFVIFVKNAYPVNLLNRVKEVAEVCTVFCATANDLEVIVSETELGRGVIGVIDGQPPLGVENDEKVKERQQFLRKIGYKR